MKMSFLFLLSLSLASASARANDAPAQSCLDSDPANREVLNHFVFQSNNPEIRVDLCDPANLAYRTAKAVLFLKASSNAPGSEHLLGGEKLLPNPFTFFSTRIKTFSFETSEFCGGGFAVACVDDRGHSDGIMHISPRLAIADDVTVSSVLVHESRHQEGFAHVICEHGTFTGLANGSEACDPSYAEGGSYGVETEYLVKLSHHSGLDPAVRQGARASAIQNFMDRFNTLPLGLTRGAVLASEDRQVSFYDGEKLTSLFTLPSAETKLLYFSSFLSVYEPKSGTYFSYEDGVTKNPIAKPVTRAPLPLLDTYDTRLARCKLYANEVACRFMSRPEVVKISLSQFVPVGFAAYQPEAADDPRVYVVSKEGDLYSFSEYDQKLKKVPSLSCQNLGRWQGNDWIVLNRVGRVVLMSDFNKSALQPRNANGLGNRSDFTKMIAPYYWSKQLQEL